MPAPTVTRTAVSASTVREPAAAAVTDTDREDTPSSMEVCAPSVPPSASTDRSITNASPSLIVRDAPLTATPGAVVEPAIDKASDSPAASSSTVFTTNTPDLLPAPAAMIRSNFMSSYFPACPSATAVQAAQVPPPSTSSE